MLLTSTEEDVVLLFREPPTQPLRSVLLVNGFILLHPLLILQVRIPTKVKNPLRLTELDSLFPAIIQEGEESKIFPQKIKQPLFSLDVGNEIDLRAELYELIHGQEITEHSKWVDLDKAKEGIRNPDLYPDDYDDENT